MARVLALGMAVIDHVFKVDALPRNAEKFRAQDYAMALGGPATVAAVTVARLGGESTLCARLGDDANSAAIATALAREGVACDASVVTPGALAPVSSIYVDAKGERQIVNFRGHGLAVDPGALEPSILDEVDAVLVDPRWPQGAARLVAMAKERGIPAVVDAESDLAALEPAMAAASHIAFSAQGLFETTGERDPRAGLRVAAQRYDAWLCVTCGSEGVVFTHNADVAHSPAIPITVRDTLGAGDVWHGAFALALAERRSAEFAVAFANVAAALKCANGSGLAAIPTRRQVADLRTTPHPSSNVRTSS